VSYPLSAPDLRWRWDTRLDAEPNGAAVASTLLTQIDDALTGAAIVIGGAFAYLKFIKGRVLTAAVGYEITAVVTTYALIRRHTPRQPFTGPPAGVLAVEVAIRDNGQIALTVPRDSVQLVSVSSVTAETLASRGRDLTREAVSWKEPDGPKQASHHPARVAAKRNLARVSDRRAQRPLSLTTTSCHWPPLSHTPFPLACPGSLSAVAVYSGWPS